MTLRFLYTKGFSAKRFQITVNGLSDVDKKMLVEELKIVTNTIAVTDYNLFQHDEFIKNTGK